jgi:hypothetical protein
MVPEHVSPALQIMRDQLATQQARRDAGRTKMGVSVRFAACNGAGGTSITTYAVDACQLGGT